MFVFRCFVFALCLVSSSSDHKFYRKMGGYHSDLTFGNRKSGRRIFGGRSATLEEQPLLVALLDRYWSARCSGTALTHVWVVTAAHCVSADVVFVKYNSRRPSSSEGTTVHVLYLYRHPAFAVTMRKTPDGDDVTHLRHDIGLVRTQSPMDYLKAVQRINLSTAVARLRKYDHLDLKDKELVAYGFGGSERTSQGEEMFSVAFRTVQCERNTWEICMCLVTADGEYPKGVCAGDSGGPVFYNNTQVAVVSMGPIECSVGRSPDVNATSVVTELAHYADLINETVNEAERMLLMMQLRSAAPPKILIHLSSILLLLILYTIQTSIYRDL